MTYTRKDLHDLQFQANGKNGVVYTLVDDCLTETEDIYVLVSNFTASPIRYNAGHALSKLNRGHWEVVEK